MVVLMCGAKSPTPQSSATRKLFDAGGDARVSGILSTTSVRYLGKRIGSKQTSTLEYMERRQSKAHGGRCFAGNPKILAHERGRGYSLRCFAHHRTWRWPRISRLTCACTNGNAALLAESLEVIQRTSALILSAIETPAAAAEQIEA